ncbi:MAG: hypothetical protein PVI30_09615 [Myxococcales bacterium]
MSRGLLALALSWLLACSPDGGSPQVGSQTNWLMACEASSDCGELQCVCGACTARCDDDAACQGLAAASCIAADDEGSMALCGETPPGSGICLPRCEGGCDGGTRCVSGVCVPDGPSAASGPATLTVDPSVRHQTLVGFGASLAYAEDPILAHPDREALYDLVFGESGLDVLRLGNRHDPAAADQTLPTGEIVAAAAQRMGRMPLIFMTSSTPPPALKANGSRGCIGEPETCTLASLPGGDFDYAGFAAYWRASLRAYADAGIPPDYISIQNNPNWVPDADDPPEACRLLPREGAIPVTIDGEQVDVTYAGYREALQAVRAAIADLPTAPRLSIPEANGVALGNEYLEALDAGSFDAIAIHLYDADAMALDVTPFAAVRDLAQELQRPVFQTEMQAEGLQTAILIHHAVTDADAAAYLQNDLVALTPEVAPVALALLNEDGVQVQDPYYALSHYAKHTDPGWVRLETTLQPAAEPGSDGADVLGSAWLAPDDTALTVVLVNAGDGEAEVALSLDSLDVGLRESLSRSQVTRTVFGDDERAMPLGELPETDVLHLPAGSIVTVALTAQ